ncbi:toll/interleukin-1 receptor domain-containing protein [Azospirillum sp. sgz301742]
MANPDHLKILKLGVDAWNTWRNNNPAIIPDLRSLNSANGRNYLPAKDILRTTINLSGFNLSHSILAGSDLSFADLSESDLSKADAKSVRLEKANLSGSDLSLCNFFNSDLSFCDFSNAILQGADLVRTNLRYALFDNANLKSAIFGETDFAKTNLRNAKWLEDAVHKYRSNMDFSTLEMCPALPQPFLRGVGLNDSIITLLEAFNSKSSGFYSCFISYSTKDQGFADKLYKDLQNIGIRCWFAPHDLQIGAKTWDAIDRAIKDRDKVLLILSRNSIASQWVEDEVNKAYAEERARNTTVLFPIRLDDDVMKCQEPWAIKLRDQRNIGDLRMWRNADRYTSSLERIVRDLSRAEMEVLTSTE